MVDANRRWTKHRQYPDIKVVPHEVEYPSHDPGPCDILAADLAREDIREFLVRRGAAPSHLGVYQALVDGLSRGEAAERLGYTPGFVSTTAYQIRKAIKDHYGQL